MKIALLVNDVAAEKSEYTTTRLAMTAARAGHEVWYLGTADFADDPGEKLRARARRAPGEVTNDLDRFLEDIQSQDEPQQLPMEDLDVLFLRNDPGDDIEERPWARSVGVVFGDLAAERGVVVVNDPTGLSKALNKMYFHHFPAEIRPRTLVTRDADEIQAFLDDLGGPAILKPLEGSGGRNVFFLDRDGEENVNQMIDAITRDGYVVAQEYLEAARPGDVRLFLMNGKPLERDGVYAAFLRARQTEDIRSNTRVGATPEPVDVNDGMLALADAVAPKLKADGMFLVGLDIAGDKLLEVNVFSPAGLGSIEKVTGVDFTPKVVEALERKVEARARDGAVDNRRLATL